MPVRALYPFRELHPYTEIERHGNVYFPSKMNPTDFEEAGKPHVNLWASRSVSSFELRLQFLRGAQITLPLF